MAVAQQVKPKTSSVAWEQMFPQQAVMNKQLSAHCMKKLLILGVSSVAYLRNMFPNSAFGDRAVEDMQLKILRDNAPTEEPRQLVTWVKALLPAIEGRHVNKVVLGVYDAEKMPDGLVNSEALLESYTFKFGSISDGDYMKLTSSKQSSMHLPTAREFKANTLMMLRTILLTTQALEKLPDVCVIALKVYFNDTAPADLSPEGFEPAEAEGPDAFAFHKTQKVRLHLGATATHHDALKVYLQAPKTLFNGEANGSPTTATGLEDEQELMETAEDAEQVPIEVPTAVPPQANIAAKVPAPTTAKRASADPFGFSTAADVTLSDKEPVPIKAKALPQVAPPKAAGAKRRRRTNPEDDPKPFTFSDSQTVPEAERVHVTKRALRVNTERKRE